VKASVRKKRANKSLAARAACRVGRLKDGRLAAAGPRPPEARLEVRAGRLALTWDVWWGGTDDCSSISGGRHGCCRPCVASIAQSGRLTFSAGAQRQPARGAAIRAVPQKDIGDAK